MIYSMSSRINVIMSPDRNGMIVPYIIEKEGRYYRVDDVKQIRITSGRQGAAKEKYLVNINGHDKFIFHEGYGWYILNEDEDERTFANPASTHSEAIAI